MSRGCPCAARADQVSPPEVLTRVAALPPARALARIQDHVLLEFTILIDGTVKDIAVIESAGLEWDEAVLAALQQWTFKPARQGGVAVLSRTQLSFEVRIAAVDAGTGMDADANADAGVEQTHQLDWSPGGP